MEQKNGHEESESGERLPSEHESKKFKIDPKWLWVGGAVAVLIIGLVVWLVMTGSKDEAPDSAATNNQPGGELPAGTNPAGNYLGDVTSRLKLQQVQLNNVGVQGIDVDTKTGMVYIGAYSGITNKCMASMVDRPEISTLLVVDPTTAKEVAAVVTDRAPIWPAVDPKRDVVYVAASSGTVAVHKKVMGEQTGSIQVGGLPHMPAVLDNMMVVSNTYDQSQTYYTAVNLDTQQVVGNHKGPRLPHPIFIDASQKKAYMMGVEDATVTVIDMANGAPLETFQLMGGGGQMAVSTKLKKAVTDSSAPGTSAAVFDWATKEKLGTIGFEGANTPGSGLAIDEESGLLFVVLSEQNAVGVASLKDLKPLAFFKTGPCPYAVKLDTKRNKGFVTNTADGTLTIFDLAELKSMIGM
jgi:hypothetical protein